jgi:hypothetical protein
MSFNQSFDYVEQLQAQGQSAAKHGRFQGDVLLGAGVVGFSHWLGNRKRKKLGLPQEPMSNVIGVPMAIGLGYVFWWLPFLVYMVLATFVIHIHLLALIVTVGIFIFAWHQWKKHRARKYQAYYTAKAARAWPEAVQKPANLHAPGSEEWLASAGERMRKNIGLG